MCRSPIRLELIPSRSLRDLVDLLITCPEQKKRIAEDTEFLKRHSGCIRLGAHCSPRMCLRPRVQKQENRPPTNRNTDGNQRVDAPRPGANAADNGTQQAEQRNGNQQPAIGGGHRNIELGSPVRALVVRNPNLHAEEGHHRPRNPLDPVIPPPNVVAGIANRFFPLDPTRLQRVLPAHRHEQEMVDETPTRPNATGNDSAVQTLGTELPHVPPAVEGPEQPINGRDHHISTLRRRNSPPQPGNVFERLYHDGQRRMNHEDRIRSRSVENREQQRESRPTRSHANRTHARVGSS
jgi:hypothetical protein